MYQGVQESQPLFSPLNQFIHIQAPPFPPPPHYSLAESAQG